MEEFETNTSTRIQIWTDTLQKNGYRLTQPRLAVLKILAESNHALDAIQIHELSRPLYPSLSLVSVYRTLDKMEELGLVNRVHRDEHCHAFIAGLEGHQHLLICNTCGKISYFSGDDIHILIDKVELESGFIIHDHWLQFFGQCQECQKKE